MYVGVEIGKNVSICVCMYLCKYVRMNVSIHVSMYVFMHVCIHVCMFVYMYLCMYVFVCGCRYLCIEHIAIRIKIIQSAYSCLCMLSGKSDVQPKYSGLLSSCEYTAFYTYF